MNFFAGFHLVGEQGLLDTSLRIIEIYLDYFLEHMHISPYLIEPVTCVQVPNLKKTMCEDVKAEGSVDAIPQARGVPVVSSGARGCRGHCAYGQRTLRAACV